MRRVLSIVVWTAVYAVPVAGARAEDELTVAPLRLAKVVAYAREHNPEISAAGARREAAQARPSQAGAWPDPMIEASYRNESFDRFRLGSKEGTFLAFGASQEVPFPGKLALKQTVATRAADEAGEEARRVELDVVSRVKITYAEYAHLDEMLHLLCRERALLEKFARAAEGRYACCSRTWPASRFGRAGSRVPPTPCWSARSIPRTAIRSAAR